MKFDAHCAVRDEIERLVMSLILELRREQAKPDLRPLRSGSQPKQSRARSKRPFRPA